MLRGTQIAATFFRLVTLVVERGSTRGDAFDVLATDKMSVVQAGRHGRRTDSRARARPGHYVGAEEFKDDGEPFEAKMPRLVAPGCVPPDLLTSCSTAFSRPPESCDLAAIRNSLLPKRC